MIRGTYAGILFELLLIFHRSLVGYVRVDSVFQPSYVPEMRVLVNISEVQVNKKLPVTVCIQDNTLNLFYCRLVARSKEGT